MGLDMYLEAEKYVGGWSHSDDEEKKQYSRLVKMAGLSKLACQDHPSVHIRVTVAYWRKANAIHRWFVEKCQDGKDECQETYISAEQLRELVDQCKRVLDVVETVDGDVGDGTTYYPDGRVVHHTRPGKIVAQRGVAAAVLPTQEGFFFGPTDYDDGYLQDLQDTVTQLEPLLDEKMHKEFTFYYRASW